MPRSSGRSAKKRVSSQATRPAKATVQIQSEVPALYDAAGNEVQRLDSPFESMNGKTLQEKFLLLAGQYLLAKAKNDIAERAAALYRERIAELESIVRLMGDEQEGNRVRAGVELTLGRREARSAQHRLDYSTMIAEPPPVVVAGSSFSFRDRESSGSESSSVGSILLAEQAENELLRQQNLEMLDTITMMNSARVMCIQCGKGIKSKLVLASLAARSPKTKAADDSAGESDTHDPQEEEEREGGAAGARGDGAELVSPNVPFLTVSLGEPFDRQVRLALQEELHPGSAPATLERQRILLNMGIVPGQGLPTNDEATRKDDRPPITLNKDELLESMPPSDSPPRRPSAKVRTPKSVTFAMDKEAPPSPKTSGSPNRRRKAKK